MRFDGSGDPPNRAGGIPGGEVAGVSASSGRKRRIWPWVLVVAVVTAIWSANIFFITGGFGLGPSQMRPAQPAWTVSGLGGAAARGVVEAAHDEGERLDAASLGALRASIAERSADFAVDPDRQTEWSYEPNGRKVVYLTIDDGPSDKTQQVLDILDKYHCKATFFVTAIDPDYFYQIGEAFRRGHTIGLHTATHDYAQVYSSQEAYFADLDAIGQVVSEQIGFVPCFIRFPGGSSNQISANYTPGIMSALVEEVQARGYQYYDWNASCGDGSVYGADELTAFACEFDDRENVVLLCHDSTTKQTTVDALPRIIEHYQSLGYTFEAIDRATMVPHHGVSN